jgi:hypothetical protein
MGGTCSMNVGNEECKNNISRKSRNKEITRKKNTYVSG